VASTLRQAERCARRGRIRLSWEVAGAGNRRWRIAEDWRKGKNK